jgi:F-type H+-transporting ATPase subunit b
VAPKERLRAPASLVKHFAESPAHPVRVSRPMLREKVRSVLQILPDLTLVVQIVLFLIFMWVMNRLLFRPTLRVLEERDRQIQGARGKAADLETRVEAAIARYNESIREARVAGENERARFVREAMAEEERIANEGRAKAAEAMTRIQESIAQEAVTARAELKSRGREFAALITEQVLGRRIA